MTLVWTLFWFNFALHPSITVVSSICHVGVVCQDIHVDDDLGNLCISWDGLRKREESLGWRSRTLMKLGQDMFVGKIAAIGAGLCECMVCDMVHAIAEDY